MEVTDLWGIFVCVCVCVCVCVLDFVSYKLLLFSF